MEFKTPVIKEIEVDGYKVKVHAATYRQFQRAATAENQMEGTATLCDQTCEVVGHTEPASELLTIKAVNDAIAIAVRTSDDAEGVKSNF